MTPRTIARFALAALVATLPACDGADAGADDADTMAADTAPASAPAAGGPAGGGVDSGFSFTEAGIDSYGRALAAEVEVLREAVEKRGAARTQQDSIDAMFAATEMQSVPAAAQRAGVGADEYRRLDDVFGRVLAGRVMNPGMNAMVAEMQDADTSFLASMPAAQADSMRARLEENMARMRGATSDSALYAGWPQSVREAFERQAPRLDTLWRERMELRARAAGMAR